jgi:hypothetical protein
MNAKGQTDRQSYSPTNIQSSISRFGSHDLHDYHSIVLTDIGYAPQHGSTHLRVEHKHVWCVSNTRSTAQFGWETRTMRGSDRYKPQAARAMDPQARSQPPLYQVSKATLATNNHPRRRPFWGPPGRPSWQALRKRLLTAQCEAF